MCANLYDTESTEPKQRKKTTNIRNAEYVFLANRKEKSMIGIGKVALIAWLRKSVMSERLSLLSPFVRNVQMPIGMISCL